MMTIPSRACAPLISTIRATTMAVIRIAAGILPVREMETILDPDQAPVLDLVLAPMAVRGLDLTAMTIITAANRRS